MTTLTWGSGGTYSTCKAAWDAAVWTDDHVFLQVGSSNSDGDMVEKSQNGYSAIIRGNLIDECICASTKAFISLSTSASATGDLTIEFLKPRQTGSISNEFILVNYSGGSFTSYNLTMRYNVYDGAVKSFYKIHNNSSGFQEIEVYGNDITMTSASFAESIFNITASVATYIPTNCRISFEDNFIHKSLTTGHYCFNSALSSYNGTVTAKRTYLKDFSSNQTGTANAFAIISDLATDSYTDATDINLTTSHTGIAFSTDNFISVSVGEAEYGIPKPGSPVYDDTSQVSDITNNIIGLNLIKTIYRTAGPYTPSTIINAPTTPIPTYTVAGVQLNWEDYSPPQTGHERVAIFYETEEAISAFVTPKDYVDGGVETYLITYESIDSFPLWYVRLTHTV